MERPSNNVMGILSFLNNKSIAAYCLFFSIPVASQTIEFNLNALAVEEQNSIDLSYFSNSNYVMPGKYLLSIRVNHKIITQQNIEFIPAENDPLLTLPCLSPELITKFAIRPEILSIASLWHNEQCVDLTTIESVKVVNRLNEGLLSISIPQAWLTYSDPDWTPPEQWDHGIPGLLFDYNLFGRINKNRITSGNQTISMHGTTGINWDAWRLRADYQYVHNKQGNYQYSDFSWNQIYAFRPLPLMKAKLTLGEMYTNSQLFDNYRFTGINLINDERMLPPALQGYAPEIHGIAKTNATVSVTQDERIIYETTVTPGPFIIQDLRDSIRGELLVKITEEDGSISTFSVETASLPYLTRPGQVRYNFALGRPTTVKHQTHGPFFSSSDFSWGINNHWSLYGGALLAGKYNAWSLGAGRDLNFLGAVSLDVTQSFARLPTQSNNSGLSFKLNWSKRFDKLDGQITFAGYRFSQRNFMSMNQYLDKLADPSIDNTTHEKQIYTITANKTFLSRDPKQALSTYLTYSYQTYWDNRRDSRYSVSFSKDLSIGKMKNINTSLFFYHNRYQHTTDDGLSLNLIFPIGDKQSLTYTLQGNNGSASRTLSYSNYRDPNNSWLISAGVAPEKNSSIRGNYTNKTSALITNLNGSWDSTNYRSLGISMKGGVTATQYGFAFHQNNGNGETRVMVDTNQLPYIPINEHIYSNRFGIAVISDMPSYYNISTHINVNKLAHNVEAKRSVLQGTLTEGAIAYHKFELVQGYKLLINIHNEEGGSPPFGAYVINKQGQEVTIIGDKGSAFLTGVTPAEELKIVWNGKTQCQITLPAELENLQRLTLPCRF